jgi:HEPN domain-containing protein
MLTDEMVEWIMIAGEDLSSAKLLNGLYPKHLEIICYHCSQSIEKYLKGYLTYKGISPPKTHNLVLLLKRGYQIQENY